MTKNNILKIETLFKKLTMKILLNLKDLPKIYLTVEMANNY